jgi:hypothetical protein
MYYVYEHIRPDTGMVFYVGKGTGDRIRERRGRNVYWQRVVEKAGNFKSVKIAKTENEELAFLAEQERIDQLKRLGYKLTNLNEGGSGGVRPSKEVRKKMSEARSGKKNPRYSENSLRQRRLRGEIPHVAKEVMAANMRANHWSKTGKFSPKGMKWNEESRLKLIESHKLRPLKECPHCGYKGKPVTIHRWHLENCKKRSYNMAEKKTTPVIIDDVEWIYEDMTDEQKVLTNHVADLDRKISSAKFNLDQLNVGKDAFIKMLKEALTKVQEVEAEPVVINS